MTIKKKVYRNKFYNHLDSAIRYDENSGLPERYRSQIEDKNSIAKHGFYPFIQYTRRTYKFRRDGITCEERHICKDRRIMYAAHFDRFVYQHYAHMLNEQYNKIADIFSISDSVIAYRNGLNVHKRIDNCNIGYAKEVFDFIELHEKCLIYITDFTKYFESIDHEVLKVNLKRVLNVERLPPDYYNVFKSVTKYSFIEKDDIFEYKKRLDPTLTKKDFYGKNNRNRFFTPKQFRAFKKEQSNTGRAYLQKNLNGFGIPQGSPISAVLSNVYLIDFDKTFVEFVSMYGGLYRRYCDDIVIIIPFNGDCKIEGFFNDIEEKFNEATSLYEHLSKSEEKTGRYIYSNTSFYRFCSKSLYFSYKKVALNYLGFTFDGKVVKIIEKSITNYYRKLHKRIRFINKRTRELGKCVYHRKLYKTYSHLGARERVYYLKRNGIKDRYHGNYISYTRRAHKAFGSKSRIKFQIKNHCKVIEKNLAKTF